MVGGLGDELVLPPPARACYSGHCPCDGSSWVSVISLLLTLSAPGCVRDSIGLDCWSAVFGFASANNATTSSSLVIAHLLSEQQGSAFQTEAGELVIETATPERSTPVVHHDPTGNAIEPHEFAHAIPDVIDPSPRDEEDLCDGVVDLVGPEAPAAVRADRPKVAVVEPLERLILGFHLLNSPKRDGRLAYWFHSVRVVTRNSVTDGPCRE